MSSKAQVDTQRVRSKQESLEKIVSVIRDTVKIGRLVHNSHQSPNTELVAANICVPKSSFQTFFPAKRRSSSMISMRVAVTNGSRFEFF